MICQGLSRVQSNNLYAEILEARDTKALKSLCVQDLFFLLTTACKRKDIDRDWLYERCREVEADPDEHLDLWARDHYKSTIITFGMSIKDILNDPNITIGIFSHTSPIAKSFLNQIKIELEGNNFLKGLFPEILYQNPKAESPKWSLDSGIIVRRTANPKESTVEAWGLVDGQPTSKHFKLRVYDDVVTRESVTTPEQIKKTTEAWELSQNLGSQGGRKRHIGTRYHANDSYKTMIERGSVKPRIKAATDNGKMDGNPVLLTIDELAEKRRDQGPYVFSCQLLQNPLADKAMGFKEEWLKFYDKLGDTKTWNTYIIVDPASKKKKTSDFTTMWVIKLGPDNNYYVADVIRDRLNLTQRAQKLFELHRAHEPIDVGYEEYGMQADIEHIQYVMEQENYRFNITPLGGSVGKEDRILRLVPVFEQHRVWLPKTHPYVDYESRYHDLVKEFIDEEYLSFPVSVHDDMLDSLARILDPKLSAQFPKIKKQENKEQHFHHSGGSGWMG